ncbi:MAG: DUF1016 domain-containing protein [Bacteroidia bacterium]|nr:DUF1016 domain-containing protein [Bacteroidia bacterium]
MKLEELEPKYKELVHQISLAFEKGREKAYKAIERAHLETYWEIGKYIIEFEQGGKLRAQYGRTLLENLSTDLSTLHGKGFSRSNLNHMRQLYVRYPICETLSHKLSWSHFVELIKIDDDLERTFYEKQAVLENWNVRELKRQKRSSLFLRLASSKDKKGIIEMASRGKLVEKPTDIVKDPYVLEFLKIPEPHHLSESELEKRLIEHLQHFLLELGKGFAFIGRQYRITLDNQHHYVDLVFYHRILKCFVLIDLKREKAGYQDVGQMNMYLGYFEAEENTTGDNPPIGIVLAREKDDLLIQYAMNRVSSQLFVSRYQLYLPNKEELKAEVERIYLEEEEI